MQNRTIHPAEFAGWRPNMRDAAMWQTILWAWSDENGEPLERNHDMSAAWREDMQKLSEAFYHWSDQADEVIISHGCGHLSLDELLGGKAEHLYVLVRGGHGVSMTDGWNQGKEHRCAAQLERLAKAQGSLDFHVGEDSRIYMV